MIQLFQMVNLKNYNGHVKGEKMKNKWNAKLKNKNIIFVDFFDTLMFRKIHPFDVIDRWAELISNHYNGITKSQVLLVRKKAFAEYLRSNKEINYYNAMKIVLISFQ